MIEEENKRHKWPIPKSQTHENEKNDKDVGQTD